MAAGVHSLTKREKEIEKLIRIGMTDKEIADMLGISIRTVNNHVKNILSKYSIHDRKKIIFSQIQ